MAVAQKRILTRSATDPGTLLTFLMARLPLAEGATRDLLRRGAVFVGGQRCQALDAKVPVGAKLRVFLEGEDTPPPSSDPQASVIYEDADLLVVDKPAGLLSQPGPSGGASLLSGLRPQPHSQLLIVHRLDREASGLLVLARHAEAAAALQHGLQRGYLALAAGSLMGEGAIDLRIAQDPRDPRLRQALPAQAPGGKAALTRYRALRPVPEGDATLVALRLHTGRTHQIRVHLRALGHPLVGDSAYGGPPAPRLMLHAAWLAFTQPRTGAPLRFYAPALFSGLLPGELGADSDLWQDLSPRTPF